MSFNHAHRAEDNLRRIFLIFNNILSLSFLIHPHILSLNCNILYIRKLKLTNGASAVMYKIYIYIYTQQNNHGCVILIYPHFYFKISKFFKSHRRRCIENFKTEFHLSFKTKIKFKIKKHQKLKNQVLKRQRKIKPSTVYSSWIVFILIRIYVRLHLQIL